MAGRKKRTRGPREDSSREKRNPVDVHRPGKEQRHRRKKTINALRENRNRKRSENQERKGELIRDGSLRKWSKGGSPLGYDFLAGIFKTGGGGGFAVWRKKGWVREKKTSPKSKEKQSKNELARNTASVQSERVL